MTTPDDTQDQPPAAPQDKTLRARWLRLRERLGKGRNPALLAGALVVLAFGGGFVTARGIEGIRLPTPAVLQGDAAPGGWGLFGKPRSADAPRRGPEKPEGFAVWRTRLDTSQAQPRACIELTEPLDPTKSYADFVLVAPETGQTPAVSVEGAELCLAGLGFADRRITLLKGLPARGGAALAANADVDFTFGEKPPFVGFAGDGVILPREESDGVGIETINVTRLEIEVWRVADRNLVRTSVSAPDPTAEGEWPSDYGYDSPNDEGARVWKGQVAVQGEPGQRAVTVFPLGAVLRDMKPGGYVIKARDASGGRALSADGDYDPNPPAQARRWIIFTDMALSAYQGVEATDVVVRSLANARTLSGIRVALVAANGEDLGEARTDGQGRARFAAALTRGEGALRPKMLMAYGAQGDLAVLDLDRTPVDLSRLGVGGRIAAAPAEGRRASEVVDGYLYADRGVYRPGETVRLNALLRDREARAVKDRKGAIVIRRPSGVEFRRFAFDGTPLGSAAADVALPRSAPRGRWRATLELEGLSEPAGEVAFSVEDFAPQRLAVSLTGEETRPLQAGQGRDLQLSARFLYGAPGAGLQAEGEARLRVDSNPFPAFEAYQWGDQREPFAETFVDLGRTVTDGEGRAVIVLPAQAEGVAQPLVAAATVSVFEPGGRPVRESVELKVRPQATYLGVKVDQTESRGQGDPTVNLDLIAVNAQGQRIAASAAQWRLISENWDYDWFQQDGRWQWRRTSRDALIDQGRVDIAAGQPARLSRRLGWGDYRLELWTAEGARSVIRFSAGWGAPAQDAEAPDIVRVSAGERSYAQGDTVEIAIRPPYAGEVQVAVATDRVLDFRTLTVGQNGGTVRFQTNASWGGGAYVMVTVVQPRDPVRTPKPRRALGLVYVPLEPAGRKLEVALGAPEKAPARDTLSVPVQVRGAGIGQRTRVTLAAVDEGILRLTRFSSPDPVAWYFGKRALGVDYRDDYGRLLDPNLGAPANVNFGGDEIGGEGLTVTPIRTVALWSGVVETGRDGRATITLPAPDFNGELRLMAVAWTDDAVGSASQPLVVRDPVVAELALPRFLAPGDTAFATLELHNIEGRVGQYVAELTAKGGLLAPFRKAFELVLGQRLAERVPLEAPRAAGIGEVGLKVSGPGFSREQTYPLQTRLGWGPVTRTTVALQAPGTTFTPGPELLAGLAAGDATLQVSYSPFRGFDPGPIAVSLLRYPYGCTEQLVSAAYPLLYAAQVTDDPRARRSNAGLNQAVTRLLDRQTLDGAFGMWRVGDGEADPWLGAYVTDFLVEARQAGAPVPQAALDRALSAMRQVSRPVGWASVSYRMDYPSWWAGSPEASERATEAMRRRASAYALYVLAKAGQGDLARLRWWHDVQMKTEASPLAKAQVGAGLALMGDRARARSAFRQAVRALGYREESDWYQSPLRDLAAVIALAHEAGEVETARELEGRLENSVTDPQALNTQEQARLLQAANAMIAAAGPLRIAAAGAIPLTGVGGAPRWAVGKLAESRFTNQGQGAVWRTVTVTGAPVAAPPAASAGLSLQKRLVSLSGAPVNPASLSQGDRVIVVVSGRSQQARATALVVDDPLPAGFEIETVLGPDDAQAGPFRFLGELSPADVQEARDDRYVAALDLPGRRDFAFAYVARAVTPGDFLLPGAEARDMYRPQINARTAAGRAVIAAGP
ncbi:alpha-2-macroglobulin family protein [Phenylobacterium sp.]|uniref:alpha-2-macroglobulin family protein n=1 Tax=Phenylobacterium sp. TaxID=1871053 RepID=UPI002FD9D572